MRKGKVKKKTKTKRRDEDEEEEETRRKEEVNFYDLPCTELYSYQPESMTISFSVNGTLWPATVSSRNFIA